MGIYVIDDDRAVRTTLVNLLRAAGHQMADAEGRAPGLARFAESQFDLVLTDLVLPHMTGWEVARAIKARIPTTLVVPLTGWGEPATPEASEPELVDRVLRKPVQLQNLVALIGELIDRRGS